MSKFCGEREVPASKFWGAFGWGEFADVEFVETGCAMLLAEELPKGCRGLGRQNCFSQFIKEYKFFTYADDKAREE